MTKKSKPPPILTPGKVWGAKEGKWKGERFLFLRVERDMWVGKSLTDGTEIEVELDVAKDYLKPET